MSETVDGGDIVVVISPGEFPYMSSALETYLIRETSPTLNEMPTKY